MATKPRKASIATEPLITEFLTIHDASEIKDLAIVEQAGLSRGYISSMRRGRLTSPTIVSMNALLGAHGCELVIRKKSSD